MARALLSVLLLLLACCSTAPRTERFADTHAEWLGYFPAGYEGSRSAFTRACWQALATRDGYCRSYRIASPSDPDLSIDYGYFTRSGPQLLVVQSGTHGAEAFAGAAVQRLLLQNHLDRLLGRGIDVLLIHALNPYGFKHNRRPDEFNVNLNRNFSADASIYRSVNEGYADLRDLFEPAGLVDSVSFDFLGASLDFIATFVAHGFDDTAITEAMNEGQYQYERGLNFGGKDHQQQTAFLQEVLGPRLADHPGRILFLDVHTGLGDAGVLHMISGKEPSPGLLQEVKALLGPLTQNGVVFNTADDPGFYRTEGDVIDFVPLLADDPDRVVALTMEYGTIGTDVLSQLRTANRMILENQAHFNGCSEESVCREVEANFRELFNPGEPAWRAAVLATADRVLTLLAEGF